MEGEGKTTHVPSEQAKQIANGIFAKYDADHNGSILYKLNLMHKWI